MADERGLQRVLPRVYVEQRLQRMVREMPDQIRGRFKETALALAGSPLLADCSAESVFKALYMCARLNLIPDPVRQLAHLVPFKNRGVKEATLIVGYRGLVMLARNADPTLSLNVITVYENDEFLLEQGLTEKFAVTKAWWREHDKPGEPLFSACISRQSGMEPRLLVVSAKECRTIASSSKAGARPGTPWHDHFVPMMEKTAIRRSAKLWTLSPEREESARLNLAVAHDEQTEDMGTVGEDGDFVDDMAGEAEPEAPKSTGKAAKPSGVTTGKDIENIVKRRMIEVEVNPTGDIVHAFIKDLTGEDDVTGYLHQVASTAQLEELKSMIEHTADQDLAAYRR